MPGPPAAALRTPAQPYLTSHPRNAAAGGPPSPHPKTHPNPHHPRDGGGGGERCPPHSAPHPLHRPLCRDPPNLAPLLTVLPPARASPPPLHPIASACRQSTCDSASRSPRATTTSPDLHLTHAFPTRFGFPPGPAVRTPGPVSTSNTLFWLLEQQGTNTHHPSISLNRPTFSTHQTKPLGEGPSPPSAGLDPHTNQ